MRYFVMSLSLMLAGCSLPTAVSQGFSDISAEHDKMMKEADKQTELSEKYGVDSMSNRALVAFSKGNLEQAQDYATQALQQNPKDVYALMVMAVVNDTLGMPNKAGFYYQAVVDAKQTLPTALGNYRLNTPQSLYESAYSRLKVIDLKQAPFIVNQDKPNSAPVFEIKEVYMSSEPNVPVVEIPALKTGMDLFSVQSRNVISRFLTLKALAEKGYITKEEFVARRNANIGGLLPLTMPMPAATVSLPVPSTDAIVDRFNSMKNAYELKSMSAAEYISERDIILEALLPTSSIEKMKPEPLPSNLLQGADEVRKLDVLLGLGLITKTELAAEKSAIETVLRVGGKPLPQRTAPAVVPAPKPIANNNGAPMPLIPVGSQTKK